MIDNTEFYTNYFKTPRTREELRKFWKCDNRTVRDNISKLQKDLNIVNLQDGKGWYIPETEKEVRAYCSQELSRGLKSVIKAYQMSKRCVSDNQISMDNIINNLRGVI